MADRQLAAASAKKRRVKVRLQFPEKLFYERALTEWREQITDRNHGYVIRKALNNLKLFPLDVHGHGELRKIRGIGDDIATRLDTAWRHACEVHFACQAPSIQQVKSMARGQALHLLEETATAANSFGKKKGNFLPFLSSKNSSTKQQKDEGEQQKASTSSALQKRRSSPISILNDGAESNEKMGKKSPKRAGKTTAATPTKSPLKTAKATFPPLDWSPGRPSASSNFGVNFSRTVGASPPSKTTNSTATGEIFWEANNVKERENGENAASLEDLLHFSKAQNGFCESRILLIADAREETAASRGGASNRRGGGRGNAKGVGEHLATAGVQCESRVLSVGDYLWVLQWKDWQTGHCRELVLDYVVERKTWDDLKRSIREPRYLEQKSRLSKSGIKNVVLVVEGSQNAADRSLEQAMISTSVDNDFLVHRTQNMQGTAKFLQHLTKRLEERCDKEEIIGPSFECLQEKAKKSKPVTVSDCWLRQLTICPGMSLERAKTLQQRFPTLRALTNFYKNIKEEDGEEKRQNNLARECPSLPPSILKTLNNFLGGAFATNTMTEI